MTFGEFLKKNRIKSILFGLLTASVYTPLIFNRYYCTDLEYVINSKGSIYNWSELGRYTLILIKKLCMTPFNPLLEGILFVITFLLSITALSYLLHLTNESIESYILYILSAIALVFPTFSEQYYFKFQSFEVLFGMFLLIVSSLFLVGILREKPLFWAIPAIALTVLSFGIYQSMLNIVLIFYILIFTVLSLKKDGKLLLKASGLFISHFFVSFLLNKLITKIFCAEGSYFSDKIMWTRYPVNTCYHFVKHYFRVVLLAEKYVYPISFLLSIIVALAALILLIIKIKAKAIPAILGVFGLIIVPFAIAIIQGFEPDSRTQLALPFSIMGLCFFTFSVLRTPEVFSIFAGLKSENENKHEEIKKAVKAVKLTYLISLIISCCILTVNLVPTAKLISCRMAIDKSDMTHLIKIAEDLKEYNCDDTSEASVPVIIIGNVPSKAHTAYTYNEENQDYILIPLFELDADTEPKYFFSTNRILGAMDVTGYRYNKPEESTYMEEAYAESLNMPSYPDEGYIKETDNYVLVNLGNQ